jgi:hypothetical protein
MFKLLKFLFGGEPLFSNSSNSQGIVLNKDDIITNLKSLQSEAITTTEKEQREKKYHNEKGANRRFEVTRNSKDMCDQMQDDTRKLTSKDILNHNIDNEYQKQKDTFSKKLG